jgi:hypothetical protein
LKALPRGLSNTVISFCARKNHPLAKQLLDIPALNEKTLQKQGDQEGLSFRAGVQEKVLQVLMAALLVPGRPLAKQVSLESKGPGHPHKYHECLAMTANSGDNKTYPRGALRHICRLARSNFYHNPRSRVAARRPARQKVVTCRPQERPRVHDHDSPFEIYK